MDYLVKLLELKKLENRNGSPFLFFSNFLYNRHNVGRTFLCQRKKKLSSFHLQLLAIVAVTTVTFTKIIIPVRVDGQSMYPTLHDEDIAIVNALSLERSDIKRFDIVVLKCEKLDKDIVKRVIGLPGDTLVYRDDKLYINGTYYDEKYLNKDYIAKS